MKITQLHFEACYNLGDYENEKIRLVVQLQEGDEPEDIIPQLRKQAGQLATPNARKIADEIWEKRGVLRRLEEEISKRTSEWDRVAEFLKAQGINPDAPSMPVFSNLLTPAPDEEQVEVIEAGDDF